MFIPAAGPAHSSDILPACPAPTKSNSKSIIAVGPAVRNLLCRNIASRSVFGVVFTPSLARHPIPPPSPSGWPKWRNHQPPVPERPPTIPPCAQATSHKAFAPRPWQRPPGFGAAATFARNVGRRDGRPCSKIAKNKVNTAFLWSPERVLS